MTRCGLPPSRLDRTQSSRARAPLDVSPVGLEIVGQLDREGGIGGQSESGCQTVTERDYGFRGHVIRPGRGRVERIR